MVEVTPSAVPLDEPKLERMSWRTTPLSVRTLTPFEPSPGYGPAVASGLSPIGPLALDEPVAATVVAVVPAAEPLDEPAAPLAAVVALELVPFDAQPTRASTPAPPSSCSIRRRLTNVARSKAGGPSSGVGVVVMARSSGPTLIGPLAVPGSTLRG